MKRWLPVLLLAACAGEPPVVDSDTDVDTEEVVDTDPVEDTDQPIDDDACTPALELDAPMLATVPLGIVDLEATGGTGEYRFTLLEPERGIGFVESRLGRLLVGDTPGVPHVVELTDDGCEGSAEITINVVSNLSVAPDRATVLPGVSFLLETSGGLGEPICTILESTSGGSLDGCVYSAGMDDGLDRIEVVDEVTGDRVVVRITVEADSVFGIAEEGWWIPVHGEHEIEPASGSGHITVELLDGERVITVEGNRILARSPGRAEVRVRDRFSGHAADVPIAVVSPLTPPLQPTARGRSGQAIGNQDFDGDGYDDVLIALPEFDRVERNGGLVAVYAGGPDGPAPEPAIEFGGSLPTDSFFGEDVAIGDWNGDGEADLAVGAYRLDAGLQNSGGVYLIPSFMSADPELATLEPDLRGDSGSDGFGTGVALCDFNGDGNLDLAVGAYADEEGPVSGTGAIHVYAGDGAGFSEEPTASRYGEVQAEDGSWMPRALFLGRDLLAGDFDGDGHCDVLSSSWYSNLDGSGQDGVVALYRGTGGPDDGGLLEPHPSRFITWGGSHTQARIGWELDVGNLDDDGLMDLVVASYLPNGSRGQVHYFPGTDWLGEAPLVLTTNDSEWYIEGTNGGDQLGTQVHFTDIDGDGEDDLLIAGTVDEASSANTNDGQVWLFEAERLRAIRGRGPLTSTSLKATPIMPSEGGKLVGILAGPAGDSDGDGVHEVFVHSLLEDNYAYAGAPEIVPLDDRTPYLLELEHGMDSPGVGLAMGMADSTGDGRPDVIASAYLSADGRFGRDAGSLWSFAGTAEGFSPWAAELNRSHPDRLTGDRFGRSLTTEVDLDGDGYRDLIVASEQSWRLGNMAPSYSPRSCGGGSLRRVGAVHVYRGGLRGFATTPSLAVHGMEAERWIEHVGPAGDFDGDGYEDVIVGSGRWRPGGGVWLLRGRELPESGTELICMQGEDRWMAAESGATLGRNSVALGDVDGDGCDDVALGAYNEDRGRGNQGLTRILWGGGPGCNTRPAVSQLVSGANNSFSGERLAGGLDLSGDGVPDLLVGSPRYGNGGSGGVVWVVSGASLARLDRAPLIDGLPAASELPAPRLDALAGTLILREEEPRARFGNALAVAEDPDGGPALAIIGRSHLGGGGALVYRFAGEGDQPFVEDPLPIGLMAGEAVQGELGQHAVCQAGDGFVLLGAPGSDLNTGAVYALPLDLGRK